MFQNDIFQFIWPTIKSLIGFENITFSTAELQFFLIMACFIIIAYTLLMKWQSKIRDKLFNTLMIEVAYLKRKYYESKGSTSKKPTENYDTYFSDTIKSKIDKIDKESEINYKKMIIFFLCFLGSSVIIIDLLSFHKINNMFIIVCSLLTLFFAIQTHTYYEKIKEGLELQKEIVKE